MVVGFALIEIVWGSCPESQVEFRVLLFALYIVSLLWASGLWVQDLCIPYIPYMHLKPYISYKSYISYILYISYISYIPYIPYIPNIPFIPYMPYIPVTVT